MLRDTCSDLDSAKVFWRVILASGEQVMTLDELDEAFDAGRIDAATLVCPPDALEFVRLGAVAGLDEEAENAASIDVEFEERAQRATGLSLDVRTRVDLPTGNRLVARESLILDDELAFRPRFPFRRLLAVPAVLGLVAVLACVAHASTSSEPPTAAAARTEVAPPPAPAPADPKPSAVTVPAAAAPAPAATLSEPQKKALAAKDKKAEAARKAKRAAAPQHGATKKSSSPFIKGGSKHDPLNASL